MRDATSYPRKRAKKGKRGPWTYVYVYVYVFSLAIISSSFSPFIFLSKTTSRACSTSCSRAYPEDDGQCDECIGLALLYETVRLSITACFCIALGCILELLLLFVYLYFFAPVLFHLYASFDVFMIHVFLVDYHSSV